jgi:hypothetical protein
MIVSTHVMLNSSSATATTITTSTTTTEPIIIVGKLSTNVFSLDKCYTCIYMPSIPNTAGIGVANVTSLCIICKDDQISLPTEGINNIYGRRWGKLQVPLPTTISN